MATVSETTLTTEEYFHWVDRLENKGCRFELVRNEPLELTRWPESFVPAYHRLLSVLTDYVIRRKCGSVAMMGDGVITRRTPDTVRCPTAMVFLRPAPVDDFPPRYTTEVPHLVVEFSPPGDKYSRLMKQIIEYVEFGVPLVWVGEPDEQAVSIYQPKRTPHVVAGDDELTGSGVLPDFSCRVADLFILPGQTPPATTS
ncbi:MAG TPA: Uma2 family endonuclease [Fimbriiglobus sp.]|nr:Uma2 family endonuclease [Fimbriiglobus sp.]